MPLKLQLNPDSISNLLLWEANEELDFFLSEGPLSEKDSQVIMESNSEQRKKEILVVRYLLNRYLGKQRIEYNENGKPFLPGSDLNISISHSGNYIALISGRAKNYAIDIERKSKRLLKLAPRFLNRNELRIAESFEDELDYYTTAWCVKECMIKWYGRKDIDFRKQIRVHTIQSHSNRIKASFIDHSEIKEYIFHFLNIAEFKLVYMLNQPE